MMLYYLYYPTPTRRPYAVDAACATSLGLDPKILVALADGAYSVSPCWYDYYSKTAAAAAKSCDRVYPMILLVRLLFSDS
jgi:hypothetical protein